MARYIGRTLLVAVVIATWLPAAARLAPESVALGLIALVPFAAPGAMIGVVLGWVSHAFLPDAFTWRRGRTSALLGALLVPPWLAALVTFSGMTVAGGVAIVVGGAWIVLIAGVGIGVGRWADARLARPRGVHPRWMPFPWRLGRGRTARATQRAVEMFDQGVLTREDVRPPER